MNKNKNNWYHLLLLSFVYISAIYAPMIYTTSYLMFWMRADPLRGQVGGYWALEIETFLDPVKWHWAVRRVPLLYVTGQYEKDRLHLQIYSPLCLQFTTCTHDTSTTSCKYSVFFHVPLNTSETFEVALWRNVSTCTCYLVSNLEVDIVDITKGFIKNKVVMS